MNTKEKEIHTFDYSYLNKKITKYLESNKLELKDFAISIGITEKTLKKALSNNRDFYISEIVKISEILKLSKKGREKAFFTVAKGGVSDEK